MVVEEMNLYCSSSSLLVMEDSEKTKRIKYCNGEGGLKDATFYSHEHIISIKYKNKVCLV